MLTTKPSRQVLPKEVGSCSCTAAMLDQMAAAPGGEAGPLQLALLPLCPSTVRLNLPLDAPPGCAQPLLCDVFAVLPLLGDGDCLGERIPLSRCEKHTNGIWWEAVHYLVRGQPRSHQSTASQRRAIKGSWSSALRCPHATSVRTGRGVRDMGELCCRFVWVVMVPSSGGRTPVHPAACTANGGAATGCLLTQRPADNTGRWELPNPWGVTAEETSQMPPHVQQVRSPGLLPEQVAGSCGGGAHDVSRAWGMAAR